MAQARSPQPLLGIWQCLSKQQSLLSQGLPLGRSSSSLAVLGSRCFVFSGEHTPRTPIDAVTHCFDLASQQWSASAPSSQQPWPKARVGHAGTASSFSNCVYISGGRTAYAADETLHDLWRFEPLTGRWEEVVTTGAGPPALSYHSMAADGPYLYMFGGCTNDHGRTNGLWRLDTRSHEWVTLSAPAEASSGTTPCGRGGPGFAVLDGFAYVAFGYNGKEELNDLWRIDVSKASGSPTQWQRVPSQGGIEPAARSVTDLVAMPDFFGVGRPGLFVFGGEFTPSAQGHEGAGQYHGDAFIFDIEEEKWKKCELAAGSAPAPTARGWFNAARFSFSSTGGGVNSHFGIVVFGGFDGTERRNDLYTWTLAEAKTSPQQTAHV